MQKQGINTLFSGAMKAQREVSTNNLLFSSPGRRRRSEPSQRRSWQMSSQSDYFSLGDSVDFRLCLCGEILQDSFTTETQDATEHALRP